MAMSECPVETGASSWGKISVMMTYLFQGWNCRAPQKYRDMILDIGTEEIAHVEMPSSLKTGGPSR